MFTNVTRVISALRILEQSIPQRDASDRLQIYAAAHVMLAELEKNLDPQFGHHIYTRENILRVDDAFAALCGFAQLHGGDVSWDLAAGRLAASLTTLGDPARWPSKCVLVDDAGVEREGTSDPS